MNSVEIIELFYKKEKKRENKKSNTNNCKNVHKPTHRNGMSESTHYLYIYKHTKVSPVVILGFAMSGFLHLC